MILDTLLLEIVIKVSGPGNGVSSGPENSVLTLVIFVLLIVSLFLLVGLSKFSIVVSC